MMAVRRPIQRRRKRASSRSEFGRKIAVDLEADADFDESRGRPSHGHVLHSWAFLFGFAAAAATAVPVVSRCSKRTVGDCRAARAMSAPHSLRCGGCEFPNIHTTTSAPYKVQSFLRWVPIRCAYR